MRIKSMQKRWRENGLFFSKPSSQISSLVFSKGVVAVKQTFWRVKCRPAEYEIVRAKARAVGCSVPRYVHMAIFGLDYKTPEVHKILFKLNKELTIHGHYLKQIIEYINKETATPSHAVQMLDAVRVPLVRALYALKSALVQDGPRP